MPVSIFAQLERPKLERCEPSKYHRAAFKGDIATVLTFIQRTKNINVPDKAYGHTPLHWAIMGKNKKIAHLLILAGADPNVPSILHRTNAWDIASEDMALVIQQAIEERKQFALLYARRFLLSSNRSDNLTESTKETQKTSLNESSKEFSCDNMGNNNAPSGG